jgi:uncharacterized protein (UPF0335 family)
MDNLKAQHGEGLTAEVIERAVRAWKNKDRDEQVVRDLRRVPKPKANCLAAESIRKAEGIVAENDKDQLLDVFEEAEREGRDVTELRRSVVVAYRKAAERAEQFAEAIETGIR